jgi:3-isopropylmalate/(R)-2-methylmalate dehydratase large subunit
MTQPQSTGPRTLFEKIWEAHAVVEREDGQTLLYIDRHLVHDGSARAFEVLADRGLKMARPDRTFAVPDHYVPTAGTRSADAIADDDARNLVKSLTRNAAAHGFTLFDLGDVRQGIVHVMGPEQGISQPGMMIVCGDSHTSTHGAMGAYACGIGASQVSHVLATQTLWQRKPRTLRVTIDGTLGPGISGKDIILAIIAKISAAGGVGHTIEYAGSAIRGLSVEGRLTVCNMSIEAGARAGLVAPDDTTYQYLAGRPYAPKGAQWEQALAHWKTLPSDPGATFDREVSLDGAAIAPMVTWGNSPEDAAPITGRVPDPSAFDNAERRDAVRRALDYMGLTPGTPLSDVAVDRVFIGSCTNSRLDDLRAAAVVAKGRKVAAGVNAMVVPGSELIRQAAEAEGLDGIFRAAGFEWRAAGCSMCVGVNGDLVAAGQRCASTSNRNFVGRQGQGARTHLVSPAMAAAAAVTGRFTDVRRLLAS